MFIGWVFEDLKQAVFRLLLSFVYRLYPVNVGRILQQTALMFVLRPIRPSARRSNLERAIPDQNGSLSRGVVQPEIPNHDCKLH
jgi:hypothetical protein